MSKRKMSELQLRIDNEILTVKNKLTLSNQERAKLEGELRALENAREWEEKYRTSRKRRRINNE